LLTPSPEIIEQLIALRLGRWGVAGAPRDKLIELLSHSGHRLCLMGQEPDQMING
jgi:hypothetical protein